MCWRHCGARGASLSQWLHGPTDLLPVWSYEEVEYERWSMTILPTPQTIEDGVFRTILPDILGYLVFRPAVLHPKLILLHLKMGKIMMEPNWPALAIHVVLT